MELTDKINRIHQLVKDGKLDEAIFRLEAISEAHPDVKELYPLACKLYTHADRKSDIPPHWLKKKVEPSFENQLQSLGGKSVEQTNNNYKVYIKKSGEVITKVRIKKSGEVITIDITPTEHLRGVILNQAQINRLFYTTKLIPSDARVLEVGCSAGWLSRFLYHMKPEREIVGVDTREDLIKVARERHPKDIKFCLPEELKGKFNVILMCEVLEHIENPEDLISTYIPYLEKNATFIISVPSLKFGYYPGHIHQYFTKQDLESILSKFTQNIEWCDNPNLPAWHFCKFTSYEKNE